MDIRSVALGVAGLAFAGAAAWSCSLSRDLEAAGLRERSLQRENTSLKTTLMEVQNDARNTIEALEAVHAAEKKRADALSASIKEIDNAPESDNGPVAPVLRRALDSLRESPCGDCTVSSPDDPPRPAGL